MLTYAINIATIFLALLYLAKDWESHKKSWRRLTVLCLIVLIGVSGIVNTHYVNKKIDSQRQADQKTIAGLKEAVDTANRNQEDNTKQFVNAFDKMSQKLNELQTQVKTAGLQKEADQLRTELRATQRAMVPPKAALTFTFERPRPDDALLQTVTLPVKNDVVHVEFTVRNETEVPALNGELTLIICNACKFATEPPFFEKLPGQADTQRNYKFDRILPKSELKTLSADIKVPPTGSAVELTVGYRCVNCIIAETKANTGTILLSR